MTTTAKVRAMQFKVTTEGIDRLGLVELCQRFAVQYWLAAHMLSHEGRGQRARRVQADCGGRVGVVVSRGGTRQKPTGDTAG
jgi:hypothetical protein